MIHDHHLGPAKGSVNRTVALDLAGEVNCAGGCEFFSTERTVLLAPGPWALSVRPPAA
jgi:hypothetical protein